MKRQNMMRMIIGILVTLSAVLTYTLSINWLLLTLFIGLNMFQFAFTNWCLLEKILAKLGVEK